MTHEDWVKWADQLENSLVRAETAKKDKDLALILLFGMEIAKDKMKESEHDGK